MTRFVLSVGGAINGIYHISQFVETLTDEYENDRYNLVKGTLLVLHLAMAIFSFTVAMLVYFAPVHIIPHD